MKRMRITGMSWRRWALVGAASLAMLFVLGNLGLLAWYHNRTYPNTYVMGLKVGNVRYNQLAATAERMALLPDNLQLTYQSKKVTITSKQLGLSKDFGSLRTNASKGDNWLPVVNLFTKRVLPAPVTVDNQVFSQGAATLASDFRAATTPAKLVFAGNQLHVEQAKDGYQLDSAQLESTILKAIGHATHTISMPVKTIAATKVADPDKLASSLQAKVNTKLTYQFNGHSKTPTAQEIANWYQQDGGSFSLSSEAVHNYINAVAGGFGIKKLQNLDQASTDSINAVTAAKNSDVALTGFTTFKTFTYCTALRGVDASFLSGLDSKLASTYADARGWGLGGQVEFKHAASGCNFTVWLTAADQMPSFGAICDSTWSCTVAPNVIINFDRWRYASDAWNAAKGNLEDYRAMVINHETGHELGFGHKTCPGPGQPAPVMQQQSIDLQGCVFNPWPLPSEQAALKQNLGL